MVGARGPKPVSPHGLFAIADFFYSDLLGLAEGRSEVWFDRNQYRREFKTLVAKPLLLDSTTDAEIDLFVQKDIIEGRLPESKRKKAIAERVQDALFFEGQKRIRPLVERATKQQKFALDKELLSALLSSESPEEIMAISKSAFVKVWREVRDGDFRTVNVPDWPIRYGSTLPMYLEKYAEQFIAAKADSRYPKSNRPSSIRKQLWFLAQALAGACCGISTRTAINLLSASRPNEDYDLGHAPTTAACKFEKLRQ